jgi:hypothetical protein
MKAAPAALLVIALGVVAVVELFAQWEQTPDVVEELGLLLGVAAIFTAIAAAAAISRTERGVRGALRLDADVERIGVARGSGRVLPSLYGGAAASGVLVALYLKDGAVDPQSLAVFIGAGLGFCLGEPWGTRTALGRYERATGRTVYTTTAGARTPLLWRDGA